MQTLKRPVMWISLFALVVTMGTVFIPQSADAWGLPPLPPLPPGPPPGPENYAGIWNASLHICRCPVDIAKGCICQVAVFRRPTLSSW